MTVVETVEVAVVAETSRVAPEVNASAQRAGDAAAKQLEQSIGKGAEAGAKRAATELGSLDRRVNASAVGSRFGTALGKGIAAAMNPRVTAALGAAATFAAKISSDQQAAAGQLKDAISNAGQNPGDYTAGIEKAVKDGERLGQSQDKTKTQIAQLTLALGSTPKALAKLSEAQNIAAGTGRSFMSVTQLLQRAQEKDTSAYQQLGIKVKDLTKAQGALAKAQSGSVSATSAVARAQQAFNDKLAIYQTTVAPTLAQQQALKRSHEVLVTAQEKAATAAGAVTQAQKEVRSATYSNNQAVSDLANKYKGQASAGANTFKGHLKELGAGAKDLTGNFVGPFTDAIGGIGITLLGMSGIVKTVQSAFARLRTEQVVGSAEGAAAIEVNSGKAIIAMEAESAAAVTAGGKIKAALAGLGGVGGLALLTFGSSPDKISLPTPPQLNRQQMDDLAKLQASNGKQTKGITAADAANILAQFATYSASPGSQGDLSDAVKKALQAIAGPATTSAQTTYAQQVAAQQAANLNSDDPKVAARARAAVAAAQAVGAQTAAATDKGYLDALNRPVRTGVSDALAAAIKAGKEKALAAQKVIIDALTAQLATYRSKLASDIQASLELQRSIAEGVTNGSTLGDAFTAGASKTLSRFGESTGRGGSGGIKGVEAFLKQRALQIARFAKALQELRKKGLDPRLIAEVASLGTDEGLQVAQTLLAGSSQDIAQVNLASAQIARAANTVGKNIADVQYRSTLAADRKNTEDIIRELRRISGAKVSVAVTAPTSDGKKTGKLVGREVSLGMKGM